MMSAKQFSKELCLDTKAYVVCFEYHDDNSQQFVIYQSANATILDLYGTCSTMMTKLITMTTMVAMTTMTLTPTAKKGIAKFLKQNTSID